MKKLKGNDHRRDILEKVGWLTTDKTWKQTFNHKIIELQNQKELKVQQCKDSMSLQKSRYLMVESTEAGLAKLADLQTYVI